MTTIQDVVRRIKSTPQYKLKEFLLQSDAFSSLKQFADEYRDADAMKIAPQEVQIALRCAIGDHLHDQDLATNITLEIKSRGAKLLWDALREVAGMLPPVPIVPASITTPAPSEIEPASETPAVSLNFASPADGAKFMATLGLPITPLKKGEKIPRLPNWPDSATTNPAQIESWAQEFRDTNFGCVAQDIEGGFYIVETDSADVELRYGRDKHKKFTPTLTIQSSAPGREHRYYRATTASIAVGNVAQKTIEADFSVRMHREQCVCPGSVHLSGVIYKVIRDLPIVEADPDMLAWFVEQEHLKAVSTAAKQGVTLTSLASTSKPKFAPLAPGEKVSKNRNIAVHDYAFHHWRFDEDVYHDPEKFAADVHAYNAEHCEPPLTAHELDTTAIPSAKKFKQYKDECVPTMIGGKNLDELKNGPVTPTKEERIAEQMKATREEGLKNLKEVVLEAAEREYSERAAVPAVGETNPTTAATPNPAAGNPTSNPSGSNGTRKMKFIRGDSVTPKPVEWIWKDRIVMNNVSSFSGEPGEGKGLVSMDIAARITTGRDFFDSTNELGPRDVIVMASEDDLEDTIVPRLIVAGADLKRVHFVVMTTDVNGSLEEGLVELDKDLSTLEKTLKDYPDVVLINVDPLSAFLGELDENKPQEMRPLYSKIKAAAKRIGVGFLTVYHWNKNTMATAANRTSGAKTHTTAPRATWMFHRDEEDPDRHLMLKGKGNLTADDLQGLVFKTVGVPYTFPNGKTSEVAKVEWVGFTDKRSDDLLSQALDRDISGVDKAIKILQDMCADGPRKAVDIFEAGEKEHINSRTMRRARVQSGYQTQKIGQWYWAKTRQETDDLKAKLDRPFGVILSGVPISPPQPQPQLPGLAA